MVLGIRGYTSSRAVQLVRFVLGVYIAVKQSKPSVSFKCTGPGTMNREGRAVEQAIQLPWFCFLAVYIIQSSQMFLSPYPVAIFTISFVVNRLKSSSTIFCDGVGGVVRDGDAIEIALVLKLILTKPMGSVLEWSTPTIMLAVSLFPQGEFGRGLICRLLMVIIRGFCPWLSPLFILFSEPRITVMCSFRGTEP